MTHSPTRLTTITTSLRLLRLSADTPEPSWLSDLPTPPTPPCSTLSICGFNHCTPPSALSDETSGLTSQRGQQWQFECTIAAKRVRQACAPPGPQPSQPLCLCSTWWEMATRACEKLDKLHLTSGTPSHVATSRLCTVCSTGRPLSGFAHLPTTPRQQPYLYILHPDQPPSIQRTVASATTLRECTVIVSSSTT